MFFNTYFFSKTYSFWQSYLKPKKTWFLPSSSDIIIVDESGSGSIVPYLENLKVTIIYTRGENINFPCFIYAVILRIFKFDCFYVSYIGAYIKLTSPKLLITFIDNNPSFYKLSNYFPNIKTVFIQNGHRTVYLDIFESLSFNKKQHVDYMLVFGNAVGELYSKYIGGNVIPIGSLKNNSISRNSYFSNKEKNKVVFISEFKAKKSDGSFLPTYGIEHDLFYKAEKEILTFLSQWCLANNFKLEICGRSPLEESEIEFTFFKQILPSFSFEFFKKESTLSSYYCIDKAEIVVNVDSSLGYESLSRGNKTACFAIRSEILGWKDLCFGWPNKLPVCGPFWTNEIDTNQFENIMNYLKNVSDKEWKNVVSEILSDDIILYDDGNTKFKELISAFFAKSH